MIKKLILLASLLFLCVAPKAHGAIALSTSTRGSAFVASTTLSWSVNVNAGDFLIVGIGMDGGSLNVATATYNGVAMTRIRRDVSVTNSIDSELWYIASPAVGNNVVVINTTSSFSDAFGAASTFTGVNLTSPIDANNGLFQSVNAASISVTATTTQANEFVVDNVVQSIASAVFTANASQTVLQTGNSGNPISWGSSYRGPLVTASSTTMGWSSTKSSKWEASNASLNPASSTTGATSANSRTASSNAGILTSNGGKWVDKGGACVIK